MRESGGFTRTSPEQTFKPDFGDGTGNSFAGGDFHG